ncbi:19529_t:CDS:2, partial [Racocetra fulgida]
HIISTDGILPDDDKIQKVRDFPVPTTPYYWTTAQEKAFQTLKAHLITSWCCGILTLLG